MTRLLDFFYFVNRIHLSPAWSITIILHNLVLFGDIQKIRTRKSERKKKCGKTPQGLKLHTESDSALTNMQRGVI